MSFVSVVVGSRLAVGLIALGTITLGGTAAAAYTGALPFGLQSEAHSLIGAPAPVATDEPSAPATSEPTATADPTATAEPTETPDPAGMPEPTLADAPVGPDATGASAHGLCTAYRHGGLAPASVAFAALAKAAGGSGSIDEYCSTIVAPGHSADDGSPAGPTSAQATSPAPTSETSTESDESDVHVSHSASQKSTGSSHRGAGHDRP